jgi:hypothetical protein
MPQPVWKSMNFANFPRHFRGVQESVIDNDGGLIHGCPSVTTVSGRGRDTFGAAYLIDFL